jgi:hypothetical protein
MTVPVSLYGERDRLEQQVALSLGGGELIIVTEHAVMTLGRDASELGPRPFVAGDHSTYLQGFNEGGCERKNLAVGDFSSEGIGEVTSGGHSGSVKGR